MATASTADLTHERLAELMLGRVMSERVPIASQPRDETTGSDPALSSRTCGGP